MPRRMFIFIVDALLIALLIGGSLKIRRDWIAFTPARDVAERVLKDSAFPPLPLNATLKVEGSVGWSDIASRNPFSPDRNDIDPSEVPSHAVEAPRLAGPRPTLVGTIVVGKDATAMIASGSAASRTAQPMKVGETIDGWTIVSIGANAVAIETRGVRQTLFMNDPVTGTEREYERTPMATDTSVTVQNGSRTLGMPVDTVSAPASAQVVGQGAASQPVVGPIVVEPMRVSGVQKR